MRYVFPALLVALIGVGGYMLDRAYPGALGDLDGIMGLVYLLLLLALWAGIGGVTARPVEALRNLAIWAVIIASLIAGYTWRADITGVANRFMGGLVPAEPMTEGGRAILRRGADGQFSAMVAVNGVRLRTLVDTGASLVVLPYREAARIGIDMEALRFTRPVSTANGTAFAAMVRLESIRLGDIVVRDVAAAVTEPDRLATALLGMSFLNRLTGYAVEGDRMTLY